MDEIAYMIRRFPDLVFSVTLSGSRAVEVPGRILKAIHSLCAHAVRVVGNDDPNLSRLWELCRLTHVAPSFEREVLRPWIGMRSQTGSVAPAGNPFARDLVTWRNSELERLEPVVRDYLDQVRAVIGVPSSDVPGAGGDPLQFLVRRLQRLVQQWTEAGSVDVPGGASRYVAEPGGAVVRPGLTSLRAYGWAHRTRLTQASLGGLSEASGSSAGHRVDPAAVYSLWCALRMQQRIQTDLNRHPCVAFRVRDPATPAWVPRFLDTMGDEVSLGMRVSGIRPLFPDLLMYRRRPGELPSSGPVSLQQAWVVTWYDLPGADRIDRDALAVIASALSAGESRRVVFCVRDGSEFRARWGWEAVQPGFVAGQIEVGGIRLEGLAFELQPREDAEPRNDLVLDGVFDWMRRP